LHEVTEGLVEHNYIIDGCFERTTSRKDSLDCTGILVVDVFSEEKESRAIEFILVPRIKQR
jgi:hypothetical protein